MNTFFYTLIQALKGNGCHEHNGIMTEFIERELDILLFLHQTQLIFMSGTSRL